jgi:hypothetical protein
MEPYFFCGIVLPERAMVTLHFGARFTHLSSGFSGEARVSILLNQIAVWVEGEHDWDIFDLRNVVKNLVQSYLAMVGYLKGYAYDFEINRVICPSRKIDFVFGVDTPCISEPRATVDIQPDSEKLRAKTMGPNGLFLHRCFSDLTSAMKHADDTGFYCYRAIESLRHHCAAVHDLRSKDKSEQWKVFREQAECSEKTLLAIKNAADPLRHGEMTLTTGVDRAWVLTTTWGVVDSYIEKI